MSTDRIPMTRQGFEKLKAELEHLKTDVLMDVEKRIAAARAEGDLRENAEYHAARETQAILLERINALQRKLSRAYIVDSLDIPPDEVGMGRTVVLRDLDTGELEEYTLVGAGEEDYKANKILVSSPLAQGLLGKRRGDQVSVSVPMGTLRLEIVDVRIAE